MKGVLISFAVVMAVGVIYAFRWAKQRAKHELEFRRAFRQYCREQEERADEHQDQR